MRVWRIIAEDIMLAIIAVVLWSPIVGLTPGDPNVIRAALAITSYVAIPAAAVMLNRPLLQAGEEPEVARIDPSVRGDALGNGDELRAALDRLADLPHVGSFAADAARQVDAARRKRRQVIDMLSVGKLNPGSIAWQHFASGIDMAETTIRQNAALVASACSSFDTYDYEQLVQAIGSGSYHTDNIDDDLQLQRFSIYTSSIDRLRNVIGNNEKVLLELDRFASEVSMQAMTPSDESSERMLREMRILIDEAHQYE